MKLFSRRGIAFKLNLLILSGVTLVIAAILALNYNSTRRLMFEKIEESAFNLAEATAAKINTLFKAAEKIPTGIALTITEFEANDQQLDLILEQRLDHNPELFGLAAAFAPQLKITPETPPRLKAFYHVRGYNRIEARSIDYDYRYHDWFQIPQELNRAVWSEPYYGESGHTIMTSYSVPFYKKTSTGNKFSGIVCADLSLKWLSNVVASLRIGQTGYAFLITKNGTFVTHPDHDLIMNESIFSIAETWENPKIREIGRRMIKGEKGIAELNNPTDDKKYWLVYTPLRANGWALGALFPQQELMADINKLTKIMLCLGISGFFMIMLVILLVSGRITKPLRALAKSADEIAAGDLDTAIPIPASHDEVGRLALSFAGMQDSLKNYIRNLTETTAAKERIESELNIASEIQMGILPKIFPPPFPERTEFDLYASIRPAREVGGDLYDFFMIDDRRLCFTIGDVSGKGVPAALFMAITQTLIKAQSKAQSGRLSSDIITRVNHDLAVDNPSLMFVTLFLGILDLTTGELNYCNGGHNPPYLLSPGKSAPLKPLAQTGGLALGVMEDFGFANDQINLNPGDSLVLFTDGVTEAMNPNNELFNENRLEETLQSLALKAVREIAETIITRVDNFAAGATQADDITILVLRYNGKK